MSSSLDLLIETLREARNENARLKELVTLRLKTVTEDPEFIALVNAQKNRAKAEEAAEADVREAGKMYYAETLDKHPTRGIEIKIGTVAKIEDEGAAETWCRTSLPAALRLDETMVKKYAKEFGNVPGVVIYQDVKVFIDSNLEPKDG